MLAFAGACRDEAPPAIATGRFVRARLGPERQLLGLVPDRSPAGVVFQRQPDGRAGLAVAGMGFTRGDVVFWGGRRMDTTFSSSRLLTVPIPADALATPGDVAVTVESTVDPAAPKLVATFRVLPKQ